MRIVFMGTPDFAVPSLEALVAAGHTVCGVFCQPDKPVGRHQNKLQPPAVKVCAQSHNIPVFQPTKLRDGAALAQLQELNPELIVVAAYGRILPDDILALPPKGCINVHSSLLPKYRGAAPINWAVINGEKETGVTIMHMATELDAGDIIDQVKTPIDPNENVEAVHDRLAQLGGELLVKVVADIAAGTAQRTPQDHSQATLTGAAARKKFTTRSGASPLGPPPPPIFWGTPSRCSLWRSRGWRPRRPPAPSSPPIRRGSTWPVEMAR